jgi:uncharacterized protein YbjT (DUF2867 family)
LFCRIGKEYARDLATCCFHQRSCHQGQLFPGPPVVIKCNRVWTLGRVDPHDVVFSEQQVSLPDSPQLGEPPMPEDAYYMLGYDEQVVVVVPARDLVIVRLGLTRRRGYLGPCSRPRYDRAGLSATLVVGVLFWTSDNVCLAQALPADATGSRDVPEEMMTTVVVFGGTGFLGRRLVHHLAAEGTFVRVAVRQPEGAHNDLPATDPAQVTFVRADVRDQTSVAAAMAGADAVVNAVSAYVEKGDVTLEAVHVQGAEKVAQEAARLGVARLVLVSGLGADPRSRSPYIRSRGRGELAVQRAFPGVTIVRPSAIFGPGDAIFGTLASLARFLPVLPLIGGGRTRLQPVYVEDVAEAVARILTDPGSVGRIYELGGPEVYTLRDLVRFTLRVIGRRRVLISLPFAVAEIQARLFELLPSPPLTTGQVDLLKTDSVVSGALPGFRELNILPRAIKEVVPTYIGRASEPD